MGYTHYFEQHRPFTDAEWEVITCVARTLYERPPPRTNTAGGYHRNDPLSLHNWEGYDEPEFNDERISFNGDTNRGLDHETFTLEPDNNSYFNFCKTAGKPYDLMVCAVLIVADRYTPSALDIASDGDAEDWAPALKFVRSTTNDPNFKLPASISSEN